MLAFAVFNVVELATWVTLLVWAFDQGGTTATGIIAVAQLAPAAITAPLASVLTDRLPRLRALRLGYLVQAMTHLAVAVALVVAAPFWAVTMVAAVSGSSLALTRPVHHALVPELARTPEELTAGNAASTALAAAGEFMGPALAGLLLVLLAPAWIFLAMGGAILLAGATLRGATPRHAPAHADAAPASYWQQAMEGLGTVARTPAAATLVAIAGAGWIVVGLLDVLGVSLAFEVLGTGPAGPGIIASAAGVGGVVGGAIAALVLVGRRRLAPSMTVAVFGIGAALALVAASSTLPMAIVLFALMGIGRATVDVAGRTLLQRNVSSRVMARIFGLQEALLMGGIALGAALAPLLVAAVGTRGAFLATAVVPPVVVLLCWAPLRRADRPGPPIETVELLRSVRMFAVLPLPQLEQLASALVPLPTLADGEVLIRQGDEAERCYLVASGSVAIEKDGVRINEVGRGAVIGEIALLRDVPRTATARAIGPVEVAALDRDTFLLVVTGSDRAYELAEDEVRRRLGEHGEPPDRGPAGPS